MTNKQPEALRLAEFYGDMPTCEEDVQVAAELRRLHEVNAELMKALIDIESAYPSLWAGERASEAIAKAQGNNNDNG